MIDYTVTDQHQRRKQCWLVFGRALLTIAILGIITTGLYYIAHQVHSDEPTNVDQVNDISVTSRAKRNDHQFPDQQEYEISISNGHNDAAKLKSIKIINNLSSGDHQKSNIDEKENHSTQQQTGYNNGNSNYINTIKSIYFSKINHDKLLPPTSRSTLIPSNNNDDQQKNGNSKRNYHYAGVEAAIEEEADEDEEISNVMVLSVESIDFVDNNNEEIVERKNIVKRSLRSSQTDNNGSVHELGDNHKLNNKSSRNDHKKSSQLKNGKKFPKYNKAQSSSNSKHSGDGVNNTNNNNINSVNKSILPKNSKFINNSTNTVNRNNKLAGNNRKHLQHHPHQQQQHVQQQRSDNLENVNQLVDERTVIVTTYRCRHKTRKPWHREGMFNFFTFYERS
jgi:hypothetical protein